MIERIAYDKLIGTTLGTYQLEQLIEQNPRGPVFTARKEGAAYIVRLLALPADMPQEARMVYLGRFQQEAHAVAALQHPNILPLLDYGNYQGLPYLVFPYVPVTPLRTLLTQQAPTDLIAIGRYLDSIAGALEYAHQRGVLHRNLSTACILIQQNRQLAVADFGVRRMIELARQATQPSRISSYDGSTESSAPEQLLGKPVDTYTDIYALGAVLYRMLTGHAPFEGKNSEEIHQKHLSERVPPLNIWRKGLPPELDGVLAKAMAKEPAQRFRSPGEVANAYHQVVSPNDANRRPFAPAQQQAPLSGTTPQRPPQQLSPVLPMTPPRVEVPMSRASTARQQQMSRRRFVTVLAAGGGVVAVAAVAALGVHFLTSPTTSTPTANTGTTNAGTANTGSSQTPAQGTTGKNVIAHTSDLPVNSAKTFPLAGQPNPGVLVHLPNNSFVAFNSTCPHAGCAVNYSPQDKLLECPCHGATFDPARNAAVVQGPAQTPLAPIKIVVNSDGTITTQ
jgi:serine/threonine protein kinase